MKRTHAVLAGLTLGLVVSAVMAVTALTAPDRRPFGRPIGPEVPRDTGAGELLLPRLQPQCIGR